MVHSMNYETKGIIHQWEPFIKHGQPSSRVLKKRKTVENRTPMSNCSDIKALDNDFNGLSILSERHYSKTHGECRRSLVGIILAPAPWVLAISFHTASITIRQTTRTAPMMHLGTHLLLSCQSAVSLKSWRCWLYPSINLSEYSHWVLAW